MKKLKSEKAEIKSKLELTEERLKEALGGSDSKKTALTKGFEAAFN